MTTLVNLKYGYDQASNRLHRLDEVATGLSKNFDERYTYDGLHRLTAFDRGQLDVDGNNLTNATLGQTWGLDPTGNWNSFAQSVTGAFGTTRAHTEANEIEEINTPTGSPAWFSPPAYDANGNMTEFPQPGALDESYTATYDAWNRLVKLENGGTVAEYQYDGLNRRIIKDADSVTRHYYHSDQWQVLEERTDANTTADRQYVWGMRYVDDLILRDHDSTRLYVLTDALFNVVALTDETGDVVERFAYQPYGESKELNPDFTGYSGTYYAWEYRFTGRELDSESGLQLNRHRYLHQELGRWVSRDPHKYVDSHNLYQYVNSIPSGNLDPTGMKLTVPIPGDRTYFLGLLNQLCPKGKFTIGTGGNVKPKDPYFCDGDPKEEDTLMGPVPGYWGSKLQASCKCVCDALKEDRNITLTFKPNVYGIVNKFYPKPKKQPLRYELNDICMGRVVPPFPGKDDPRYPRNDVVRADPWLVLAHELCGHALPQISHPRKGDKRRFTVDDPVLQIENEIREEHGCGCRTGGVPPGVPVFESF